MGLCTQIQIKSHRVMTSQIVKHPFRVVTITSLSLLLPLSFLVLARISCARFLLALANDNNYYNYDYYNNNSYKKNPYFFSIFLNTNPALLYFLVSVVSVSTLIYNLTGKPAIIFNNINTNNSNNTITTVRSRKINLHRPIQIYASWIFLCALQVCVGLGIEGTIALGIDFSSVFSSSSSSSSSFSESINNTNISKRTLFSKIIFFVGLHETMLHWCGLVVRPVVDDTIFGADNNNGPIGLGGPAEKWARRGALAGGFGSLWYWRLRDEVDMLVVNAEVKGEMFMEVGFGDFVGWWLYYLTVTVGMVRVVKGLMWVFMSLFRIRIILVGGRLRNIVDVDVDVDDDDNDGDDDDDFDDDDEEKVMMISRGITTTNVD